MNEINEPQVPVQPQTPPQPEAPPQPQAPPPVAVPGIIDPRQAYLATDPARKSSPLATMLSVMPGLGQVYVGHYHQGFVNILVIGSLIAMLADGVGRLEPLMGIFLAFYWLYNMVDAGRRASFYNMALTQDKETLMEHIPLPDDRASLLAGVALVFFGGLFLLHNVAGFSLDWMEDWWPIALIVLGGYLIYKSAKDAATAQS